MIDVKTLTLLGRIIMDLLNLHVPPHAIVTLLKDVSDKVQYDDEDQANDNCLHNGTVSK